MLSEKPKAKASSKFWQHWGDGKGELSGYKGVTSRYGHIIEAESVLVYVTEPLHRKTFIKNDWAKGADRINVLKLNRMLKFRTGIYPYSVMTSTFSPVDQYRAERFAPAKVTFTAQEWCGHVFQGVWPASDHYLNKVMSYFASEGEKVAKVETRGKTLYEDGLFTQLRELDGDFLGGKKEWQGWIVPSLWRYRKLHRDLKPVAAKIVRQEARNDGRSVIRFTLSYGSYWRSFDVEQAFPKRIVEWKTSDGERFTLQKTIRLPYWSLHNPGDERYLKKLGL